MSHVLSISDELYARLEKKASERGFSNIEQLLDALDQNTNERDHRSAVVKTILELRDNLTRKYGEMPDSTPQILADRER
jgi:hypothetical protein